MRRVTVALQPSYEVVVGPTALQELPSLLEGRRRATVVTQQAVLDACGASLPPIEGGEPVVIPEGEDAKSFATVEHVCRELARRGMLRGDVLVAFGGGVVGDTAGFTAAVYHRGIAVVQAPTTLLAQVDAAIGGKTAVNLPEGKNLVGAFHQPLGVVADTSLLGTLPDAEYRSGLGEVVKYALMPEGGAVARLLDDTGDEVRARDPEELTALVAECVAIKAAVVAADPLEQRGTRATLNFGHTFAHALETATAHAIAHGEAVGIGLVFATNLALALERVTAVVPERARSLVEAMGLPAVVPTGSAGASDLLTIMQRDKKAKGGLTFVLPGPNGLETVDDPPPQAIDAAFRSVGVEA